jgi:hypothetical protein
MAAVRNIKNETASIPYELNMPKKIFNGIICAVIKECELKFSPVNVTFEKYVLAYSRRKNTAVNPSPKEMLLIIALPTTE